MGSAQGKGSKESTLHADADADAAGRHGFATEAAAAASAAAAAAFSCVTAGMDSLRDLAGRYTGESKSGRCANSGAASVAGAGRLGCSGETTPTDECAASGTNGVGDEMLDTWPKPLASLSPLRVEQRDGDGIDAAALLLPLLPLCAWLGEISSASCA